MRSPVPVIAGAVLLFAGALLLFARLGQEFIPTLDEKNIAMHALRIPSTSLTQSQAMQLAGREDDQPLSAGRLRVLEDRHGRGRRRSDAAQRLRHLHHPEAARPVARPALAQGRAGPRRSSARCKALPGNNYEFTQPIQMRFNELLAGVRGDIAVKVFGDEFEPMLRGRQPDRRHPARRRRAPRT